MISIENKIKVLSPELQKEAVDFIDFLIEKKIKNHKKSRPFGLCKDEIKIYDNFYSSMSEEELKDWGIE